MALAAAVLLGGCYSNVALYQSAPRPGSRIVVRLTDTGVDSMARWLGPGIVSVDGRVLGSSDDTLALSVIGITDRRGVDSFWKGERVAIPRSQVALVQERKLSRSRSALLAGSVVVGSLVVSTFFHGGIFGADKGGGGPGNTQ
jgi:hypothetical protein